MDLSVLTDEGLEKYVKVVADDFRIKCQTRSLLRKREANLAALAQYERTDHGCALCPKKFSIFQRSYKCTKCSRQICSKCYRNPLCIYCIEERDVAYKSKEWAILWPIEEGKFGHAKFECKDFHDKSEQEWYVRTKLELHIVCYLKAELDNADIRFITITSSLETAKRKLVAAMDNFDGSSPYNQIDDALHQIKIHADAMTTERYSIQPESCTYFHLLANAVITTVISQKKSASLAIAAAALPKTCLVSQKPTHTRSTNTGFRRKKYSHRTGQSQMQKHTSSNKSNPENSKPGAIESRFANGELTVFMDSKIVEVKSGDLVKITCTVQTDCEDLDVKWYHGEEELPNDGRFRALRKGLRHCLEIYDCNTSDQGEIMCTAINHTNIASDTLILNVKEEDIAGEEPRFLEPLTAEEIDGKLVLKCAVTGYPIPYITFHRRSKRIQTDRQCTIKSENGRWILKLNNCNVDDEGRYTAVARNRFGRTISCRRVLLSCKNPDSYIADV